MSDYIFLLLIVLPIISATAFMMDNDGWEMSAGSLKRILRWNVVFFGQILLGNYWLFS